MTPYLNKIIINILQPAATLLLASAVIYFLWGVMQYVYGASDEDSRKTGKDHIIYGLIGLFIMVSVRAIIAVITNTIGV